jgi:hypothetical protein
MVKTAVWKRVRNCVEWLRRLCENIYRNQGLLVDKPEWPGNKRVCLMDATEDASCGSAANKIFHRLHYCIGLFTLSVISSRLTGSKIGGKISNFSCFGKDDIVIGDRIYGTIPGIEYLRKSLSGFVLRLRAGAFNLYDGSGGRINLIRRLKGLKAGETADLEVFYKSNGKLVPLRIRAVRKSKSSEREGLARLKHGNQRKRQGREVSKVQAMYNKYIIVATSMEKEVSAKQVTELYRMRWQIEITFKRLKPVFKYDGIAGKTEQSVRAWLYGKLLLAALCETLVNKGRSPPADPEGINNKIAGGFDNSRASLWREEILAELIVTYHILDSFNFGRFVKNIHNLSKACSDSHRERTPQLCVFSSA